MLGFTSDPAYLNNLDTIVPARKACSMTTANKTLLQRFFQEIYNVGDLQAADELVATNYINHNPAPGETPGREGLKAFVAYLRRAFADLQITIEDQVAEGDKVVTRFTISGRQEA